MKNIRNKKYFNLQKIPWLTNIRPTITKEFKQVNKKIWQELMKHFMQKPTEILPHNYPKCITWIVHALADTLSNERKKYLTCTNKHQQGDIKDNWMLSGATEHTKDYHG